MKRLNKQPRELRPMDPGIYKWMSECPVEEQMIYVKRYANMQLEKAPCPKLLFYQHQAI
tara:strand:+ start:855 stop:1031 length:177 start_codon:yes stop_codon:yes gene_type:complete